jgi:NAD(P)-dependent dehydrogenase (short-subunit alcohol dehydrogenase family)
MRGEFSGRTVTITGAGSGIGRSTALLFARLGAKVHLADLDADRVEEVRREIEALDRRATAHVVDVSDPAAVETLAERVFGEDKAVDVLHNNAGIGHAGPVEETTLDDWQRVIAVNLLGTIYGVHFFVPRMLRQGRPGHVVNTASGAGLVAWGEMAPYCTSKFGVVGLSEALSAELAPKGIQVTAVCPGFIDTPIVRTAILRGGLSGRTERIGDFYRKRGASPDVVAEAVVDAVRKRRLIQPVPRAHVVPAWLLKRLSPRAAQAMSRRGTRLIAGRH